MERSWKGEREFLARLWYKYGQSIWYVISVHTPPAWISARPCVSPPDKSFMSLAVCTFYGEDWNVNMAEELTVPGFSLWHWTYVKSGWSGSVQRCCCVCLWHIRGASIVVRRCCLPWSDITHSIIIIIGVCYSWTSWKKKSTNSCHSGEPSVLYKTLK